MLHVVESRVDGGGEGFRLMPMAIVLRIIRRPRLSAGNQRGVVRQL